MEGVGGMGRIRFDRSFRNYRSSAVPDVLVQCNGSRLMDIILLICTTRGKELFEQCGMEGSDYRLFLIARSMVSSSSWIYIGYFVRDDSVRNAILLIRTTWESVCGMEDCLC